MMQIALGINGQDCTLGDGNTPAELEAIAITLLRAAEGIRNGEEGTIECIASDGRALAFVHLHDCGMACGLEDNALEDPDTLERLVCLRDESVEFHSMTHSVIDRYRRISVQS